MFFVLAAFALLILLISPLVKESLPQERRTAGPWWKTMSGYGSLLHNKPFLIHICYKGCALGMLFAYVSSAPFILQDHYGLSQTHYGLIIGLNAIFVAAGAMLAMKFHPFMRAPAPEPSYSPSAPPHKPMRCGRYTVSGYSRRARG